jgi:ParB-like chromosome segregation protein Spo0J
MEIRCVHSKLVDIADLRPNPRNPNKHPDTQVALLAKNIRALGWRHPIIVSNRSGYIVAGHCRLEAARVLQCTQIPVDYQNFASDAEEMSYLIADNRIAELAEMDNVAIKNLLEELDTGAGDMDLTGYTEKAIEELMTQMHVETPEEKQAEQDAKEKRLEDNPKLREWIEKRKKNQERGKDANEVNFWLCLVFQSHAQKHQFLEKFPGLETVYGMYVDGEAFSDAVGKPVDKNTQKPLQCHLDKSLTGMVGP